MVVINNQNIISNDAKLELGYLDTQKKVICHFEETLRMLETESEHACQRRWNDMPHSLQIREYHTLERLKNALANTPLYKRAIIY